MAENQNGPDGEENSSGVETDEALRNSSTDNSMYEGYGVETKTLVQENEDDEEHASDEDVSKKDEGEDKSKKDEEDSPDDKDGETEDDKSDLDDEYAQPVEGLDMDHEVVADIISVFKEKEIPREEAEKIFQYALDTGDMSKVDMKALEEKVGKAQAGMMMRSIQGAMQEAAQAREAIRSSVFEIAGGEDQWELAAQWAAKPEAGYTAEEKDEINRMLAAGGMQTKIAAKQVVADWKAKDEDYKEDADTIEGDGKPEVEGPLTRREYTDATQKEHARPGGPRTSVLKSLNARREAGMKKGM